MLCSTFTACQPSPRPIERGLFIVKKNEKCKVKSPFGGFYDSHEVARAVEQAEKKARFEFEELRKEIADQEAMISTLE